MALRMLTGRDSGWTDEIWASMFALRVAIARRFDLHFTAMSWEELKDQTIQRRASDPTFTDIAAFDSGRAVGWIEINLRGEESEAASGYMFSDMLPEQDPREFARAAAPPVAALLQRHGVESIYCMCDAARREPLMRLWDGKVMGRIDRYRLYRDRANDEVIDSWLESFDTRYPGFRLEYFIDLPEEHIDAYISLYEQFLRDMPNETDQEIPVLLNRDQIRRYEDLRRKSNSYLYTVALFDKDNRMIGHCNGAINGNKQDEMYQAMTGIAREWRGQGLAKVLKAALYRKTGEDFPDNRYIATVMRAVNEPILAINRQMGYELLSQGHEWIIKTEAIRKFGEKEA